MEVKKTLLLIWFYTGGNILGSNGGKLGGQRLIDRRKPSTGMAQPMTCEGDPASGPRCVHGQCRRHPDSAGPSRCVCDRGWTGPTCDGADTSSPRSAGRPAYNDGAHTNYLKKIVQHVVSEHKKHLHSDSESRDHVLISGQPSSYNDHVAAPTSGEYQATSGRDACSEHYVSHRTELRTCRPGLLCKYGVCSSENKDTYIAYTCTCDKGATGLFCETRCCLDCGTGGQCVLYGNGTRYCECKWGRTGDRCQHTWPHPQVKRHTRDVDPTAAEGAPIDRYSWIVWVSCPAALLAVTGLLLVSCIMWRTWAARTQKEFTKCRCYEDTRRYDVLVWCQYGDVTEPLAVKEIVPKLERLSLKVCLYVGTPSYRTALEDRLLSLVSSSRCVILLYIELVPPRQKHRQSHNIPSVFTPNPPNVLLLVQTPRVRPSDRRHIHRDDELLLCCGTVVRYPTNADENEYNNFWRSFKKLLPHNREGRDNTCSKCVCTV